MITEDHAGATVGPEHLGLGRARSAWAYSLINRDLRNSAIGAPLFVVLQQFVIVAFEFGVESERATLIKT